MKIYIIFFLLYLLFPTICIGQTKPVPIISSFYPGFSTGTGIYNESIIGSWTSQSLVEEIKIESLDDGSYHVFSVDNSTWNFFQISFKAKLFRIENTLFVDLIPMGTFFSDQLTFQSHTFAIIEILPNSIKVSVFDPYYVAQYLTKNSNKISSLKKDNHILVTEPTSVIQRILIDLTKSS
ncbi:MAG: hypothetical protein ACFFCW_26260, partial [Candidatus Hodarchaeota archaeon]